MLPHTTQLTYLEINPPTPAIGSVIWMHGLGANGNDFAPIVPQLHLPSSLPLRFIFPHAPSIPVTINQVYVMPAWYDITSFDMNQRIDQPGITRSIAQINDLIALEEKSGIPSEKILLAGFSQGAVMALMTGLQCSKPLAGIIALSGYLASTNDNLAKIASTAKTLPIFLAHGTQDTVVPYQASQLAYAQLTTHGFAVEWHSYPMAHGVCDSEIRDIAAWIKTQYSEPRP